MNQSDARAKLSPPALDDPRQRRPGWHTRDVARAAALVLAVYYVGRLLWLANQLVLVAVLGLLFGLAVAGGADRLARFRIPRGLGAAMIVIGFFALLAGLGAWMTPTIREQGVELRAKLPEAVDRIEVFLNQPRTGFLGAVFGGGAITPPTTDSTSTATATPPETLRARLGRQLGGTTRYLFPFLSQTATVFAGVLLIVFMAIYIGADPALYRRGLMHLVPHRARGRAGEVLSAIANVLRRWLVTQLIAMVVIGAITTTVLLVLKVRAAFALGLIAGLLEFIPTVGPILSAVPAVAMGFIDSPEKALTVMLAYVGIQFVENHLLIPMLMKGGVQIPPVLTILGQALFTMLFGFLGLMVAVPVLAAVLVAVRMLYVQDVIGDDTDIREGAGG